MAPKDFTKGLYTDVALRSRMTHIRTYIEEILAYTFENNI